MAYTIREVDSATTTIPAGERAQIQPPASEAGQTYFEIMDMTSAGRDLHVGGENVDATGMDLSVYKGTVSASFFVAPKFDRRIWHRDDLPYVYNDGSSSADVVVKFRVVTAFR